MKNLIKSLVLAVSLSTMGIAFASPVNINTADAKTIAANVNGVGTKKAELIVAYRKKHGAFKSASDLTKVKGIGPKIVEKNKDVILVKSGK